MLLMFCGLSWRWMLLTMGLNFLFVFLMCEKFSLVVVEF